MTHAVSAEPIIDTHAHLDDAAFAADVDAVLADSRAAGVVRFVNIGYAPEYWHSSSLLRNRHADVEIVLGLHPQMADVFDRTLEDALLNAVEEMRPVGIGETGLDYARPGPTRARQVAAFRAQLAIADASGLPVVIHQRDASADLLAELDRWQSSGPIVLHSFDGDDRLLDWARERGCYFGVGGLATKRSSLPLRDRLRRAPIARLLLETDSPYLAPPGASNRRNTPANLPRIAEILAPLWSLTGDQLCATTTQNACGLFSFSGNPVPAGAKNDQP